jgi:hypothetical protein
MSLSTTPETKPVASAADAVEARLQAIAELLVYGASQQEILGLVQKQWGVSQRTAQDDLHTVRQRLAGEAATEDQLFALRVSQLQRDKLVGLALRYAVNPPADLDPQLLQALASLITAVRGLLDSHDRTAAEIQHLVEERLAHDGKVAPPPEAPCPAAPVNGHAPAAVALPNGKGHVRRNRNGACAAVSRAIMRPPLPADAATPAAAEGGCDLNYQAGLEIKPASRGAVTAEAVCAGCAGSPLDRQSAANGAGATDGRGSNPR